MKASDWLPWLVGAGVLYLYERERSKLAPELTPSVGPGSTERNTVPAEFRLWKPVTPAGYSRMTGGDVPASIRPKLPPLLSAPLGTVTKLPTEGRDIVAVIEAHFHEPGGPVKPWGWHKGVSLFERKGSSA